MKGPCLADQMPHLVPGSRRCFEVLFLFVFCAGLRTLGAVDDRGRSLLNVEAAVVDKNGADYGISPHRDGIHYASAVAMLQDGAAPDSSRRGLLSLKDSSVSDEGPDSSTTTTTVVGYCPGYSTMQCASSQELILAANRMGEGENNLKSNRWQTRYKANINRLREGNCQPRLVWYGDSIVEYWHKKGWDKHYGSQGRNFAGSWAGIAGDTVSHLLWRLQNGEMDGINPIAVVVHIGINDILHALDMKDSESRDDWATMSFEVAQYMESVLGTIRKQWCGVQIVMVSLLTASQDKDDMSWPNSYTVPIAMVNYLYQLLGQIYEGVHFADCQKDFFVHDGSDSTLQINEDLLPDALHPSKEGYDKLAQCVERTLKDIGIVPR